MAEDNKVQPMNMNGDLEVNWKAWRKEFEVFAQTPEMQNQAEAFLVNQMIVMFGMSAIQIINKQGIKGNDLNSLSTVLDKFEEHFTPKKNLTLTRHKFMNLRQRPGFNISQYVIALNRYADSCEWGDARDEIVKTVLINGMMDDILRQKLLHHDVMTLQETIEFCRMAEEIKKLCKSTDDLNADGQDEAKAPPVGRHFCGFCGGKHERGNCPAYKKTCTICKKPNHIAKMCRNKKDG